MLQTTTPLLAQNVFHLSTQEIGMLASVFAGSMVLATFIIVSWVQPRSIEYAVLIAFLLLMLALPLYAIANSPWQLDLLQGISGLASGMLQPFLITLITKYSLDEHRERNLALYSWC